MAIRELTNLRILPTKVSDGRAITEIYRPFFFAGILCVLTAGCSLGAIALLGLASQGSYTTSAWTPYVLAHANSQLYGWVGFFVMGFALQQHAPKLSKVRLFHSLAVWSLGLMALGIAIRFVAEPMSHAQPSVWVPIGVGSAILQFAAYALFMTNISVTRFQSEPLSWQTAFVFASLSWWGIVAFVEPFYFASAHQSDAMSSILFIAKYAAPYRDAQFLGFVSMMIFGVSLVKMHTCFGAQKACPYWGTTAFVLWMAGLFMRIFGWIAYFDSGMVNGNLYFASGWILGAGAICVIASSRLFSAFSSSIPSHKFVRAAYAWLLISGVLICLERTHLQMIGAPFSHAYIGAIRHALTVGFISQMILGVSLRVVAAMNDLPAERMPQLWTAFVLINLGNAGRVGLEVATDYTASAFSIMGVTGFIELIGLLLWAIAVIRPMLPVLRSRSAQSGAVAPQITGA